MQLGQQNSTNYEEKSAEKQHSQRVSLLLVIFAFTGLAMSIVLALFSFKATGSNSSEAGSSTQLSEVNFNNTVASNFSQPRFMGIPTGQPAPDFTLTSLND